jgi:pyrimidine deaminase RibD-like protein
MKKEMPKIRVLDQQTGQTLFESNIEESEKAYEFAAQMEEMGLDVVMDIPTLSETLSQSLGLNHAEQMAYQKSIEEEIDQHDGSCCFTDEETKKQLN